jgi:hypothetical protein
VLKIIGVLAILGLCIVAIISLAGEGTLLIRYLGAGFVVILLMATLGYAASINDKVALLCKKAVLQEVVVSPVDDSHSDESEVKTELLRRRLN